MRLWVKLWTDVLADPDFMALSSDARLTFYTCLALAGRCDNGGSLQGRVGVTDARHVAFATMLPDRRVIKALAELAAYRFIENADGVWTVLNWNRYQSGDETNAQRQHRYRERKSNGYKAVTKTSQAPLLEPLQDRLGNRYGDEAEQELDTETDSVLANARTANGRKKPEKIPNPPDGFPIDWPADPDDVVAMIELAKPFLVQFGNCKSATAQAKYQRDYTTTLAAFRGRGHRTLVAWECFAKRWIANGGAPLFGKLCGGALDFAPRRSAAR